MCCLQILLLLVSYVLMSLRAAVACVALYTGVDTYARWSALLTTTARPLRALCLPSTSVAALPAGQPATPQLDALRLCRCTHAAQPGSAAPKCRHRVRRWSEDRLYYPTCFLPELAVTIIGAARPARPPALSGTRPSSPLCLRPVLAARPAVADIGAPCPDVWPELYPRLCQRYPRALGCDPERGQGPQSLAAGGSQGWPPRKLPPPPLAGKASHGALPHGSSSTEGDELLTTQSNLLVTVP